MSKKDLLRCEIPVIPTELAITKLLNPKPKFELIKSSFIERLSNFLPEIKQANEKLQNNEILQQAIIEDKNQLMRTKISLLIPNQYERKYIHRTGRQKKMIDLDLYLGVLDTIKDVQE